MYAELQGKIYANDPHFDNLQARLVHRTCIVGETLDGWIVEHTVEILDFGKPPRVVVDPDLLIADEGTDTDGNVRQVRRQAKTQELLAHIYELLAAKPQNVRELAHATGQTPDRIKGILRELPPDIAVLHKGTWGNVYGLVGVDYRTPLYSPTMQRIVEYIRQHGSATVPELSEALGTHKANIQKALATYPDVLRQAGTRRAQGEAGGKRSIVWELNKTRTKKETA